MKNPKLITKPFAQNGQKNAIPENYSSSMESNQATWDTGFGPITMISVAAGGLPPKGQDFNGIFNQLSENIVYLSKGGKFKFSADYAASINGYPKGAILQSDDEKKEYQSIIDNNKVNFNTATQSQINTAWKLISTDDILEQIAGKQPSGNYALKGDSYTKTESDGRYQPKGDYAPAGNSYSKAESDAKYPTVTVLNSGLGLKIDKTSIVQSTGTSTTQVMSQDAVTKSFMKPGDFGFGSIGSGVMLQNTEVLEEYRTNAIGYAYGGSGKTYKNGNHSFLNVFGHFSGNYGVQIAAPISSKNDIGFRIISNNNVLNWAELYHTDNTSTDRNGYLRKAGTTEEMQGVPIGASILWNTSAQIPANFWPNEGRSFSSSEYPDLAKVYPSLKLPDDRGYAIRIADNGRGVDAGRIVGTYQDCAIENITGKFGAFKAVSGAAIEGGAFKAIGETGASHEAKEPGVSTFDFDASRVVRTANETRMKNVAKILITRMK